MGKVYTLQLYALAALKDKDLEALSSEFVHSVINNILFDWDDWKVNTYI